MDYKPRQFGNVIHHEGYVGCLDCGSRTYCAHGNTETCARQGGRIIHAVTHHCYCAVACDDPFQLFDFVLGQQFSMDLVDADLACDSFGGDAVVAGQHDYVRDPGGMKLPHDFTRLRTNSVGNRNKSANMSRVSDDYDGFAIRLQSFCLPYDFRRILAAFNHIAMGAEPEQLAVKDARQPLAPQHLHIRCGSWRNAPMFGVAANCARQRVRGVRLKGRRARYEFGFRVATEGNDLHNLGFAAR